MEKRKPRWFKVFIWIFAAAAFGFFCFMIGYVLIMLNGQKILSEQMNKMVLPEASIIYDASGNEVTKLFVQNRELISLKEMPALLPKAFIATEDKRFYEHNGVDFVSLGRAIVKDVVHHSAVEGGSTITQQLAKNIFLNADKTIFRKATEMSIAMALENKMTKDQIIELYLNRIYFGGSYGVKAAAKHFFNKDISNPKQQLTLAEIATLAAIPKSPTLYSPISNPDKSKERRNLVLQLMLDQGYITSVQKDAASKEQYKSPVNVTNNDYVTFLDYVMDEADANAGITEEQLHSGGYKIYTTMNATAQKNMETAYNNANMFQKDSPDQKVQSSMVIIDHRNGGLVALIGGRDYQSKGWNHALQPRQPGSAFKPIAVYGPALETGQYNPYSILVDEKQSFGDYTPQNYNNQYLGKVSMFDAVRMSMNLPAVWLLNEIGVKTGMKFSANLGIPLNKKDNNLAIALGGLTDGASPLQLAQAYGAFANQGVLNKTHSIVKILDSKNNEVYTSKPESKRVMSAQTAYYMTLLLQEVVRSGTGTNASIKRPVAGKTGTTQLGVKGVNNSKANRDVWFVGYTPEWSAAVWMGYDTTDAKHYITIGSGATASLFANVVGKSLAKVKVTAFKKPDGVPDLVPPPKPIQDLAGEYSPNDLGVKLHWTPSDGKVEYKLFRKESSETDFKLVQTVPTAETVDIDVKPDLKYQYYVVIRQTDSNVETDKSNNVEITIPTATVIPTDSGAGDPSSSTPSDSQNPTDSNNPDNSKPSPEPSIDSSGTTTSSAKPTTSPTSKVNKP